jgi:hypothetical protein
MGKADGGRGKYLAARQGLGATAKIAGQDANAGDIIFQGRLESLFHVVRSKGWIEQGEVYHLCDVVASVLSSHISSIHNFVVNDDRIILLVRITPVK